LLVQVRTNHSTALPHFDSSSSSMLRAAVVVVSQLCGSARVSRCIVAAGIH